MYIYNQNGAFLGTKKMAFTALDLTLIPLWPHNTPQAGEESVGGGGGEERSVFNLICSFLNENVLNKDSKIVRLCLVTDGHKGSLRSYSSNKKLY